MRYSFHSISLIKWQPFKTEIKRILNNISLSASIFNISPTTLYLVGKCCDFINRVTFVNPRVCEKFSAAAFACVMCDLGNYSNITANTHSLFCHASTFIQWAQMELGVSLGALTENSIEKGKDRISCIVSYIVTAETSNEKTEIFSWGDFLYLTHFLWLKGNGNKS